MSARNPVEDLRYLFEARSFSHLQEIAMLLKSFYCCPMDLCKLGKVVFKQENVDAVAFSILKRENLADCTIMKPIATLADGNCLFNAASMAFCGSAKYASELRLRTAMELILNIDFYTNHPLVVNAAIPVRNSRHTNVSYTIEGMYVATIFSSEASAVCEQNGFRSAMELEIRNTAHSGNFSGLLQIMGLASAMGCNIRLVYPDKSHFMLPLLDCTYTPRQARITDSPDAAETTVSIMWTDMGGWRDRSKIFQVNHFVLLATVNKEWHVVSRRKKTSFEGSTKPNTRRRMYSDVIVAPSPKCTKFDETRKKFADSSTTFGPRLPKTSPTQDSNLTKAPLRKPTFTKSNHGKRPKPQKTAHENNSSKRFCTQSFLKPSSSTKLTANCCGQGKPFQSNVNFPLKTATTTNHAPLNCSSVTPTSTKSTPCTRPTPTTNITFKIDDTRKSSDINGTHVDLISSNPHNTNAKSTATSHVPAENSPQNHGHPTNHDHFKPALIKYVAEHSIKSSTQTCLTDYFQNNRTGDETICHNKFECKIPKSQSSFSKQCFDSNVSSIALATASKQ